MKLTQKEINKRMVEWRNLKKMYANADQKRNSLSEEIKELKQQIAELSPLKDEVEKLKLRIEELERGKFRANRDSRKKSKVLPKCKKTKKTDRSNESYRRPIPKLEDITDEVVIEVSTCPECGAELTNKEEHIHYVEDLKKKEESLKEALQIIKVTIESARCEVCNTLVRPMDIPKQKVVIGENLRQMIVFKTIYMGLSYAETQKSILAEYGISFSNGHIANILDGESKLLSPYYEKIISDLKNESAHYDETSWKTKSMGDTISEGNYCWIKVGVNSNKQLIWFGKSRGKGVAEDLRGEKQGSEGVSDDYGAYKNLFEAHELCWAHPNRKLRDLAESNTLAKKKLKICKTAYLDFKQVYAKAEKFRRNLLIEAFDETEKQKIQQELEREFLLITETSPDDPEKLKTIRSRLKERKDKYFTFVKHPMLPLDNNKAERKIRKIVLKRKKSFGSRSQKGADTLSILYSVIFTITDENPDKNFFELYQEAAKMGNKN
jgi:transposase